MTSPKSPDLRKEEIFQAAIRCFSQKGYYSTSIDDIAKAAGISKGGVYHHFRSKQDLFIALFHAKAKHYFKEVTAGIDTQSGLAERLDHMVVQSHGILEENKEILNFCLEFITMGTRDRAIRDEVTLFYKDSIESLSLLVEEAAEAGTLRDLDREGVARTLFFFSMGFFLVSFAADPDVDPDHQHTINTATLAKGIMNPMVPANGPTGFAETSTRGLSRQ